jgi:hypothetical protein
MTSMTFVSVEFGCTNDFGAISFNLDIRVNLESMVDCYRTMLLTRSYIGTDFLNRLWRSGDLADLRIFMGPLPSV